MTVLEEPKDFALSHAGISMNGKQFAVVALFSFAASLSSIGAAQGPALEDLQLPELTAESVETMPSILLSAVAAKLLEADQPDDAAFAFMASQLRFQIDRKIYPPKGKGGNSPSILMGALGSGIGPAVMKSVHKDPDRMLRFIKRIRTWKPRFPEDYKPGWDYEAALPPDERQAIVKKVKAKSIKPLRELEVLYSNDRYKQLVKTIAAAEETQREMQGKLPRLRDHRQG